MNDYFGIIVSVLLLIEGLQYFMNRGKLLERIRGKYTEESISSYRKIMGAVMLIAAVASAVAAMGSLGYINMGENFRESNIYLILELVVLGVIVIGLIIGQKVILKPLDNASVKKGGTEDEDF